MSGLRITCVRRVEGDAAKGYWTARVTVGGRTYDVDRRSGSWRRDHPTREGWRIDLPADIAAELQRKVRPLERRLGKVFGASAD
jgi:hypothetical protein